MKLSIGSYSLLIVLLFLSAATIAVAGEATHRQKLEQQVFETERAFARTMADRDFEAFQSFLSEEAVFFSGPGADRGNAAVAERWSPYFESAEAPFSWQPEQVQVLDSGTLALSTGPVLGPGGDLIAHFTSIWRIGDDGSWHIVFDKGNRACVAVAVRKQSG